MIIEKVKKMIEEKVLERGMSEQKNLRSARILQVREKVKILREKLECTHFSVGIKFILHEDATTIDEVAKIEGVERL